MAIVFIGITSWDQGVVIFTDMMNCTMRLILLQAKNLSNQNWVVDPTIELMNENNTKMIIYQKFDPII